jgi:hypothetical protein
MTDTAVATKNPYLDAYQEMFEHQKEHIPVMTRLLKAPEEYCYECVSKGEANYQSMRKRWSWAIPNDEALDTIVKYSPNGLIEIGAGAGYWTSLLRGRGLDVVAYDINPPPGSDWTLREETFTEVITGDHTNVVGKGERTLFMCWPEHYADWPHETVELYDGDTIIYVGEGCMGCTGDPKMHVLLGTGACWHDGACDCPKEPLFEEVAGVEIPQWSGMHDRLYVFSRR